jgi:hypothetical protein
MLRIFCIVDELSFMALRIPWPAYFIILFFCISIIILMCSISVRDLDPLKLQLIIGRTSVM